MLNQPVRKTKLMRRVENDYQRPLEALLEKGFVATAHELRVHKSTSDSGGTRQRWSNALKELKELGLASQGGSGRTEWHANLQGCVEQELAPHGAMPEEVELVVKQVLHSLAAGMAGSS